MSNEYAQIIVTKNTITPGYYELSYQWDGNRRGKLAVSRQLLSQGFSVKDIPYPLKKIEHDDMIDGDIFIRTDVYFWWITECLRLISKGMDWFNHRLLLTASVWDVVRISYDGTIPSWKLAIQNRWKRS
jgi:hypothetical protein